MLRSVLKDCKQVKREFTKLNQYLDNQRTSDDDSSCNNQFTLVERVKAAVQVLQDFAQMADSKNKVDSKVTEANKKMQNGMSNCEEMCSNIEELISFDVHKIRGGSVVFQKEMDTERDVQIA